MKDCLLIANMNTITCKEVFPLLKDRIVSMGAEKPKEYDMPDGTIKKFGNICWFTTLRTPDKKKLVLTKTYDPDRYPKYDNYDAINVDKVKDIPYDYDGVMGVPITILDFDLDNVEIVGLDRYVEDNPHYGHRFTINGKETYARALIKKNFEIVDGASRYLILDSFGVNEKVRKEHGHCCNVNGKSVYTRILIRKRNEK